MAGKHTLKKRAFTKSPKEKNEDRTAEEEQENAIKVVQIMQVISEDLGEKEKRMWRKMLGNDDEA
ncbi:MAG: hypothetical protein EAX81_08000 [Candidatus Thorarchaeota archaeon]|nr:hypothetical protein [Candidatus Thorarchaeota archaeon]